MPRIDKYVNRINYPLRSTRKKMIAITIIIFFLILDRLLKVLALNYLNIQPIKLVGDFFSLNFASNYNIAFSLPFKGFILNVAIIFLVILLINYFILSIKRKEVFRPLFFLLIILGAASNLYDRMIYGFVIDYLDLKYFTAFNLADAMIVIGAMCLIICMAIKK